MLSSYSPSTQTRMHKHTQRNWKWHGAEQWTLYVTEEIICLAFLKPKEEQVASCTLLNIPLETFQASRPTRKRCTQLWAAPCRGRTSDVWRNRGKEVVDGTHFKQTKIAEVAQLSMDRTTLGYRSKKTSGNMKMWKGLLRGAKGKKL